MTELENFVKAPGARISSTSVSRLCFSVALLLASGWVSADYPLDPFWGHDREEASSLAISIDERVDIEYHGFGDSPHTIQREYNVVSLSGFFHDAGSKRAPSTLSEESHSGDSSSEINSNTKGSSLISGYWWSLATSEEAEFEAGSVLDERQLDGNNSEFGVLTGSATNNLGFFLHGSLSVVEEQVTFPVPTGSARGDVNIRDISVGISALWRFARNRVSVRVGAEQTWGGGEFKISRQFAENGSLIDATLTNDIKRHHRTGYFATVDLRLTSQLQVSGFRSTGSSERVGARLAWNF